MKIYRVLEHKVLS